MSVAYIRSSPRSKQPSPNAMHGRPRGPEPSAPHGSGLPERICSSSCLSWLHLLKSWSLRQSRGGSHLCIHWPHFLETRMSVEQYQRHYQGLVATTNRALERYTHALPKPYHSPRSISPFTTTI